jgi:hypothetical protein
LAVVSVLVFFLVLVEVYVLVFVLVCVLVFVLAFVLVFVQVYLVLENKYDNLKPRYSSCCFSGLSLKCRNDIINGKNRNTLIPGRRLYRSFFEIGLMPLVRGNVTPTLT